MYMYSVHCNQRIRVRTTTKPTHRGALSEVKMRRGRSWLSRQLHARHVHVCALVVALVFLGAPELTHQTTEHELPMDHVRLTEQAAQRTGAYCNDYSPAHYYVDRVSQIRAANGTSRSRPAEFTRRKWIVFLEGGGVCQFSKHCTKRYLSSSRRLMSSVDGSSPVKAMNWQFPTTIAGKTLLSRGAKENPELHDASRLVIPYCSSDLWLGRSEIDNSSAMNFYHVLQDQRSPDFAERLGNAMAFRGVAIFRTIFEEAWEQHGLRKARNILVAGSSAGGVAALNQIEWIKTFVAQRSRRANIKVSVLSDSSWFVDFRLVLSSRISPSWVRDYLRVSANDNGMNGTITDRSPSELKAAISKSQQCSASLPLAATIQTSSASSSETLPVNFCSQFEAGYPCCLSLQCVIRHRQALGLLDNPFLAVISKYDAYLPSVAGQQALATITDKTQRLLQAARLAIEFGAVQIMDVTQRHRDSTFQSTFMPPCTQHVYLATSSLWDRNGVLGSIMSSVHGGSGKGVFTHEITEGLWRSICNPNLTPYITSSTPASEHDCAKGGQVSLREAVSEWWRRTENGTPDAQMRTLALDTCEGISCNPTCPQSVQLGGTRQDWSTSRAATITLSVVTYLIAVFVMLFKLYLMYYGRHVMKEVQNTQDQPHERLSFPPLATSDAITVSCLAINYSVKLTRRLKHPAITDIGSATADREQNNDTLEDGARTGAEHARTPAQHTSRRARALNFISSLNSTFVSFTSPGSVAKVPGKGMPQATSAHPGKGMPQATSAHPGKGMPQGTSAHPGEHGERHKGIPDERNYAEQFSEPAPADGSHGETIREEASIDTEISPGKPVSYDHVSVPMPETPNFLDADDESDRTQIRLLLSELPLSGDSQSHEELPEQDKEDNAVSVDNQTVRWKQSPGVGTHEDHHLTRERTASKTNANASHAERMRSFQDCRRASGDYTGAITEVHTAVHQPPDQSPSVSEARNPPKHSSAVEPEVEREACPITSRADGRHKFSMLRRRKSLAATVNQSPQCSIGTRSERSTAMVELEMDDSDPPPVEDLLALSPAEKRLLDQVSIIFRPGELVAIMGPSGCGKTTLLELLTGRRTFKSDQHHVEGNIFVNGLSLRQRSVLKGYIQDAGYVRQLAAPYYEELTVRQNLVMAAFQRLGDGMSVPARLDRVERVMKKIGLESYADTVAGGTTGTGLSGGQKRKLCVGLQLLQLPKVLFLDEPTSGLDSTSTLELLEVLSNIATSGRLVILSIHQPRTEVVHMFNNILFLHAGKIMFYGSPIVFPGLWVDQYLNLIEGDKREADDGDDDGDDDNDDDEDDNDDDATVIENTNIADKMMDLLQDPDLREVFQIYNNLYGCSPQDVEYAVARLRWPADSMEGSVDSLISKNALTSFDKDHEAAEHVRTGLLYRILVWESRASMRAGIANKLYLFLVMLGMFIALGGAYFRTDDILLLLSALCLWTLASSLFMTPAIHFHLLKALEIFKLEHDDGVGGTIDLVVQTFARFSAMAALPIIAMTPLLYLMITSVANHSAVDALIITAIYLQLNFAWTAFGIFLIVLNPMIGFKLAPLFSSLSGFVGGFIIPIPKMEWWYKWVLYINPNYYAYSAIGFVYLQDYQDECKLQSKLECYTSSGLYYLQRFAFDNIQPAVHSMILFLITLGFLLMAWLTLEIRFNQLISRQLGILQHVFCPATLNTDCYDLPKPMPEQQIPEKPYITFHDYLRGDGKAELDRIRQKNGRARKTGTFPCPAPHVSKALSVKSPELSLNSLPPNRKLTERSSTLGSFGMDRNTAASRMIRCKWRLVTRMALCDKSVEDAESRQRMSELKEGGTFEERALKHGRKPVEKPMTIFDLVNRAMIESRDRRLERGTKENEADRVAELNDRRANLRRIMKAARQKKSEK